MISSRARVYGFNIQSPPPSEGKGVEMRLLILRFNTVGKRGGGWGCTNGFNITVQQNGTDVEVNVEAV